MSRVLRSRVMRTSSNARPNDDACTTRRPSTREFRVVWECPAMTTSTSGSRAWVMSLIRGEMVPNGNTSWVPPSLISATIASTPLALSSGT